LNPHGFRHQNLNLACLPFHHARAPAPRITAPTNHRRDPNAALYPGDRGTTSNKLTARRFPLLWRDGSGGCHGGERSGRFWVPRHDDRDGRGGWRFFFAIDTVRLVPGGLTARMADIGDTTRLSFVRGQRNIAASIMPLISA
jgi:hypothetical protein